MFMDMAKVAVNDVVLISDLLLTNPALADYVRDNAKSIETRSGVAILDDTERIRGADDVRKYLQRHYGKTVNLTEVRKDHRSVYLTLCALAEPEEFLVEHGFEVEYTSKYSEDQMIESLEEISVNGIVRTSDMDKGLYNRVRYRAVKSDQTIREYLSDLGFHLAYSERGY